MLKPMTEVRIFELRSISVPEAEDCHKTREIIDTYFVNSHLFLSLVAAQKKAEEFLEEFLSENPPYEEFSDGCKIEKESVTIEWEHKSEKFWSAEYEDLLIEITEHIVTE